MAKKQKTNAPLPPNTAEGSPLQPNTRKKAPLPPGINEKDSSDKSTEGPEENERDNPQFWLNWITNAKKGPRHRHVRQTRDAYREYEKFDGETDGDTGSASNTQEQPRVYPAYYSAVNTLEPALYSRTPDLITERRFELDDEIADMMSLICERAGNYVMENSYFDDVMSMVNSDFIHGSKATNQIVFDAEFEDLDVQKTLIPGPIDGVFLIEGTDGEEWTDEVQQDPMTGAIFGIRKEKVAKKGTKRIRLAPAPYDEILHTKNAKIFPEITEIAFYFCFNELEAKKQFKPEVLKNYAWKSSPADQIDKTNAARQAQADSGLRFIDGYEIWDKVTKKVRFVSEGVPGVFLKEPEDDPLKLRNFFPCPPFIIQGKPSKNMFPTPAWIHVRPTAEQLHLLYQRIFRLIDAVRRRAIVDGEQDVVNALNAGEEEFISAKTIRGIVEKGGLENMIWYVPVQELVNAINEANAQEEIFAARIDKWMGVPDVLQGVSDPIESLGAQEIKAQSAHDRFKNQKKKLQTIARDNIEMMLDLFFKVYDDQEVAEICGVQFMSEKDQENYPLALKVLRNDETRLIRIGIDTDSLTFVDQGLKTQQVNATVLTVTNGLKQASEMLEIDPSYAIVAMEMVLLALNQSDVGMKFKGPVRDAVTGLVKKQEEEAKQPKEPPTPDPKILQIESNERIKMQELQLQMQKMQFEQEYRMAKLGQEAQDNSVEQTIKAQELNQDAQKDNDDSILWSREIAVKEGGEVNKAQIQQFELGLQAENQALEAENRARDDEFKMIDRSLDHREFQSRQAEKDKEESRQAAELGLRAQSLELDKASTVVDAIATTVKAKADLENAKKKPTT